MASGGNEEEQGTYTYDLLNGEFTLQVDPELTEITQEDKEKLDLIFNDIQEKESAQKDADDAAFEANTRPQRFLTTTSEDLDKLEAAEYEKSTHWQTAWAVKCFKGTSSYFSIIIFKEISK